MSKLPLQIVLDRNRTFSDPFSRLGRQRFTHNYPGHRFEPDRPVSVQRFHLFRRRQDLYCFLFFSTVATSTKGVFTASIYKALKFDGSGRSKVTTLSDNITDLLVYHSTKQNQTNQCATSNGGCSHLCLALPADDPVERTKYTCACPTHYKLQNNECKRKFFLVIFPNVSLRDRKV